MTLYSYDGPVLEFNRIVMEHYKMKTQAVSEAKARANLTYRFKKIYGYQPGAKLTLPGKITVVE